MKETKSLKVILVFIVFITVIYNLLVNVLLKYFEVYETKNIFFAILYNHVDAPADMMIAPQFLNWLFVVLFVFFSVMFFIRSHINRLMNIEKSRR